MDHTYFDKVPALKLCERGTVSWSPIPVALCLALALAVATSGCEVEEARHRRLSAAPDSQSPSDTTDDGDAVEQSALTATTLERNARAGSSAVVSPVPSSRVTPRIIHTPIRSRAGGAAQSWDGRLVIVGEAIRGGTGWGIAAFRPETLRPTNGVPSFPSASLSDLYPLELDFKPGSGMMHLRALAMVPDPDFDENPYRSTGSGAASLSGNHETYRFIVYSQNACFGDCPPNVPPITLGRRKGYAVVQNPRTVTAAVHAAVLSEPFRELRTTSGKSLLGIEPSVTVDGRLLVYQGHPDNDGKIVTLMYSWNADPRAVTGWSDPRSVADLFHVDRDRLVAGMPFHERYPIAKVPLRKPSGQAYVAGEIYIGAYPWISFDGTELFHTSTFGGPSSHFALRTGFSVIGRMTGNILRYVDGPANQNRLGDTLDPLTFRHIMTSPGAFGTFWSPFSDVENLAVPYLPGRPTYMVFGTVPADYDEVSFNDYLDGDFVLYLPMNEMMVREKNVYPKGSFFDPTRTPDTSGHFNTGLLQGGAVFPVEHRSVDVNVGIKGNAIFFNEAGRVLVAHSAALGRPSAALTVQAFVKPLVDFNQDSANRYHLLIHKPGAYHLIIEENGTIQATVSTGGVARRSGAVGPPLARGRWTHVAFTYSSVEGLLKVYVGGRKVSEANFPVGDLDRSEADLIVGPGGQTAKAPFFEAHRAAFLLDEVAISRVVRTPKEIAEAAFIRQSTQFTTRIPLPLGLRASDLKLSGPAPTSKQIALGKMLFFEPRLSANGTTSCATCHKPDMAFTDGFVTGIGLRKDILPRNTPTVLNRAFSTAQFLDGRALSLIEQALAPIENPKEMGGSVARAVEFLNSIPEYVDLFQGAFAEEPSEQTLARALASFEVKLLSGNSRVDRFEAGETGALTVQEERGRILFRTKGRCTACHSGSNYTDEQFHNNSFLPVGADSGRQEATRRRKDRGAFKTPTLRDVARTAPYLHDGSVETLEAIVALYNVGGIEAPERDPEIRPLELTGQEQTQLVAFLQALTGETPAVEAPMLPELCPPQKPAPNWGQRNAQCLRSCSALGGTRTAAASCGRAGLVEAGVAYDAEVCCREKPPAESLDLATTYAELRQHHSACSSDATLSGPCRAAAKRLCVTKGYGSGFGVLETSGDDATVNCVAATAISVNLTTFATLGMFHPGCTAELVDHGVCRAAIGRLCSNRGFLSGFGPLESSGDDVWFACVRESAARVFTVPIHELQKHHERCVSSIGASAVCAVAARRFCLEKGYSVGFAPTEVSRDFASFMCMH